MATPEERAFIKELADTFESELLPTLDLSTIDTWVGEDWWYIGKWLFETKVPSGAHVTLDAEEIATLVSQDRMKLGHIYDRMGEIVQAAYNAGKYVNRNQLADFLTTNGCRVSFG